MRAWLFPVIIFDLAFLPMFHIFGLPLKPSYVLIPLLFLSYLNHQRYLVRSLERDLLILFFLLAGVTLLGTVIFLGWYQGSAFVESLRNVIIYMLAPMAFIAGAGDTRRRHNYIVSFLFAYAGITLIFSVYYLDLEWVAQFYGLQDRISSGAFAGRSQGLFFNANVSALFMTLLFLYFMTGVRYRFIQTRTVTFILAIAATVTTVLVLGSRNQLLAVAVILLLFFASQWNVRGVRKVATRVLVSLTILVFVAARLGSYTEERLGYDPVSSAVHRFSRIADSDQLAGSYLRPILNMDVAIVRWSASPLVGTGFDVTGSEPFEANKYHNDWLYVLTSAGIVGLALFAFIVFLMARLDIMFLVLFLLPGMTNSFIFAPSNFLLLMFLAGIAWRRKLASGRQAPQEKAAVRDSPITGGRYVGAG